MFDSLALIFFKFAATGKVPAKWFEPDLPDVVSRQAKTGQLSLEIVSHCWKYSHFLAYQLSSLVRFPPEKFNVVVTVFYSPEDEKTVELLKFFEQYQIPKLTWNWRSLPRQQLFRRGIGRNLAALETRSDWVWFTDCDLMFLDDCLDVLHDHLEGKQSALYFPQEERTTELLAEDDPMLQAGQKEQEVLQIDTSSFTARMMTRATGPLQIAHGDVCRAVGYCRSIGIYQKPSDKWCKAHEDRAFRWLLRTQGEPLPVPGVYRIRHINKGRYTGSQTRTSIRSFVRRIQSWFRSRG